MSCLALLSCLLATAAAYKTLAQVDRAFDGQLDILGGPTSQNALRLLACLCGLTHSVYYAVNNVGSNVRKPTLEYSTEDYRHVMSTNLDSTYRLCQVRAAADMVAAVTAPIRRHVVSLTMDAACIPAPGEGRGKASKHHYGGQRGRRADINEERHYIRDDQRYKLEPSLCFL